MALIIAFRNISDLADVSDYEVGVYVNERLIDQGRVEGHRRADGYLALVENFVERRMRETTNKQPRKKQP